MSRQDQPRREQAVNWADLWPLDPNVTFLNHGSFGACPLAVLEAQQRFRDRMELEPVRFFTRELEALLDAARAELAVFVGADADDLAFVPNATAGINTVLRSLSFDPGDELLTTDHAYNAIRNALEFAAGRAGARVVVARVPFPIASADRVIEAVMERITPRTRLAVLDHVTSPTGLIFPARARSRTNSADAVSISSIAWRHSPGSRSKNLARTERTSWRFGGSTPMNRSVPFRISSTTSWPSRTTSA